jgi:hypothetical protein
LYPVLAFIMAQGMEGDIFKELRKLGKEPLLLSGDRDEDSRAWSERVDLMAQLRGLGDSAKIALAVLLCRGKALEKARTIARTGSSKAFLEKLMQELAPENRLKYWCDKFLKLELGVNESLDAFLTRLLEVADGCKAAQSEYWESMSQTEQDDFMEAARRASVAPPETTAAKYYRMVEAKVSYDALSNAQQANLTDPGDAPDAARPYYMLQNVGSFASRIDYNRVRDSDFLKLEITHVFLIQVLRGALWNFPALKRAGFMLKHATVDDAVKDLEDTRRHAIKTLAEDSNDAPARAVLIPTRKNRTLEFLNADGDVSSRGARPLSSRDFRQLPGATGQDENKGLGSPHTGTRTPRPHTPHPHSANPRSGQRQRREPQRLTYTNNVEELMDELRATQEEVNMLREQRTNYSGGNGGGRRTGGNGTGGFSSNKAGGTSTTGGKQSGSRPAQYGCKACRMIFGGEDRKHYLSDCPHGDRYRDLIAQMQKGLVNNVEAKVDSEDTSEVNNAEHDHKHIDAIDSDKSKKAKSAKSKKGKGGKNKSQADIAVAQSTTFSILEEESDDQDDINYPPLSGKTQDDVNHFTASPVDLEFARELNKQLLEEPLSSADLDMNSLNFQEHDCTLDVEASEKREALYEQIVDDTVTDECRDAGVNAIANYDHIRSTATFKIPGMGLTRVLSDTGAGLEMLRENLVPPGAVIKALKKPIFVSGFNSSTAERITHVVRLALETADGAAFQPRWFYVTKTLNYGIILSKEWLNAHECHWQMSSSQDKISLLSTNKGRVDLEAKEPDELEHSVCMVQPREAYAKKKFLNEELDGEVVGRLVLQETITIAARQGVEISPKVKFIPEDGSPVL